MWDRFLGQEDPLVEGMETHYSILAWRIPWTEEPGRLQSVGSQESDMTEHAHTTQQTYLKHIFSFCVTTYTFTVICEDQVGPEDAQCPGLEDDGQEKLAPSCTFLFPPFAPFSCARSLHGCVDTLPRSYSHVPSTSSHKDLPLGPGACRGAHQ